MISAKQNLRHKGSVFSKKSEDNLIRQAKVPGFHNSEKAKIEIGKDVDTIERHFRLDYPPIDSPKRLTRTLEIFNSIAI